MKRLFLPLIAAILLLQQATAQNLSSADVQQMVNTKNFIFEAQSLTPGWGGLKQLTGDYYLKISGDTMVSYLPFFGRVYTVSPANSGIGFDFTSTNFDYTALPSKKSDYKINIRSKDIEHNTTFLLTVFDNGRAFLQVTSADRQPVSYNGYIKQ